MPTYRVDRAGHDLPRVIVAPMPTTALMHVAKDELTVRRIEVDEAFALAEQGVRLERAGEDLATIEDTSSLAVAVQEDASDQSVTYEPGVTGAAGTHYAD